MYLLKRLLLVLLIVVLASPPLFAADPEFKSISTERLKDLLENTGISSFLIDARTKAEFQEAHIGQAVNMPEKEFDQLVSLLPADKQTQLVIYCNGVKCGKSKKVAAKAQAAGYGNILLYSEGFPVWEEKGLPVIAGPDYAKKIETTKLSPAEIHKILKEKSQEHVIVDVRDEFEFEEGHIPSAINIPAETFASKSGVLPKDKKIIVYCNSGGRSYMAYRKLMKLAYPNIYQGIFAEWKEAKLPVEK